MKIIIVEKNGLYETKKWLYIITRPFLWILTVWVIFKKRVLGIKPKINTLWFDGLSVPCRMVKEGAGSWRALNLIYNFKFGQNGIRGKVSDYWSRILTAQAVRNRLKLTKGELIKAIESLRLKEENIQLLSIPSGSGQAVIEAVERFKSSNIHITLLDLDQTALDYSRKMAEEYGIADKITFIHGNILFFERFVKNRPQPHIIEMVGFIDYLTDLRVLNLIKRIYKLLLPGGIFITGNICPNAEQHFLTNVVDWPMIYRRPEELRKLLLESGFEECRIICEPLKIFAVGVCNKCGVWGHRP